MSDLSPGTRGPAPTYPVDVPVQPVEPATVYTDPAYSTQPSSSTQQSSGAGDGGTSKAKQVAGQTKDAAGQAAGEVKDTAKEQVQRVGAEAKNQARGIASDVRDRVGSQARTQNERLVGTIRQTADQLDEMRGDRDGSPAATVVSRVADGGRQLADYLDRNGPEGVLREVTDFARRRPGAFLATAVVAGFVVGRLGKSVAKADSAPESGKPSTDSYVSGMPDRQGQSAGYGTGPGYTTGTGTGYTTGTDAGYAATGTGTEYAATGTGRPVVVEETYVTGTERLP